MKKIISILSLGLTVSSLAFAHGEDKLGPNGGFIRMPGAFHTELVPTGNNTFKIFLLDINWKNPLVTKSSLQITHNGKSKAECKIQENYYQCAFSKIVDLTKKGELKVLAQREEQKGVEVSYQLPLKIEIIDDGHGGHN